MRYIKLNLKEVNFLENVIVSDNRTRPIKRARAILLSNKGESVSKISTIMDVPKYRIYQWFNRYETQGFDGLYDKGGTGRKLTIDMKHKRVVEEVIRSTLNIKASSVILSKKLNIKLKPSVLKYFLKKIGYSYKGMKHTTPKEPDSTIYNEKKRVHKKV